MAALAWQQELAETDAVLAERFPESMVLAMKLLRSVVTLAWRC